MSAFKYQWNQTIDVGTAGLLSKQWTSIRHILSLLVTANACVHVTAYVAVRRSLSTTYTAVVLGLLLRQYVSYQFGVWAVSQRSLQMTVICLIQFANISVTGCWIQLLNHTADISYKALPILKYQPSERIANDMELYRTLLLSFVYQYLPSSQTMIC